MLETAYCVSATLFYSVDTIVTAARGRLTVEKMDTIIKTWARKLVDQARIELDVRGRDAVDWTRPYVIMSNHQSLFDIPVLYVTVPGTMRMAAKKELFKLPFFGPAIRAAGTIEIDRGHRDRAIASLKAAGSKLGGNAHIWIAPEGTRSRTGALGRLKKGGFALAAEIGTPILPVAIQGTNQALPADSLRIRRGAKVRVTFGEAIPVDGQDREQVRAEVQRFLEENL